MSEDHVDRVRRRAHLPHDGETGVEVASRIFRFCSYLEERVGAAFATAGLRRSEADLLAALLRSPEPRLSAGLLAASTICSTGTMTNRLDRLERAGMIRRHDDPQDRRGVLIELSSKGRKAIVAALAARDAIDGELAPGLTVAERRALAGLLRKALVAIETAPPRTAGSTTRRRKALPPAQPRPHQGGSHRTAPNPRRSESPT